MCVCVIVCGCAWMCVRKTESVVYIRGDTTWTQCPTLQPPSGMLAAKVFLFV